MIKLSPTYKILFFSPLLMILLLTACKENNPVEPAASATYSGQYQNVKYDDNTIQPDVSLTIVQNGDILSGNGSFNGILFNFSGTLIQTHMVISFNLINTNVGDLKNCIIDGYFGANNFLAGGYTLSYLYGTQKIRFEQLKSGQ